jgi:aspartate/glutamate racemase
VRIALIHALAHSVAPINEAMARLWPQARCMNLLDDSLSADLARSGQGLDAAMHQRFETLTAYAEATGVQGILFTCSAFGPCIEAAAAHRPQLPVFKPNEAMVADAAALGCAIGLIASFAPTLASMPGEFPAEVPLHTQLVAGAMQALDQGRPDDHDAAVVAAAMTLKQQGCGAIALAQFSMARAAPRVREATGLTVLTTPDSAVLALRRRLSTG